MSHHCSLSMSHHCSQYHLSEENNIHLKKMVIFQIFGHKTPNKEETTQNKEKYLFYKNLLPIQKYLRHCQL
jgi:hypothetical protein